MIGTVVSCITSGVSPPDSVVPKPAIWATSPGCQRSRSPAAATGTGVCLDAVGSLSSETSLDTSVSRSESSRFVKEKSGWTMTRLGTCFSPAGSSRLTEPRVTSMACPGWPIGTLAGVAPVIEEQCPAVTTVVGEMSVPVQAKRPSIEM